MVNSASNVFTLCDSFNFQASTDERHVGGSSRPVITYIVSLLPGLPNSPTLLDNACCPGYATVELLKAYADAHVYAVDVAPGMISLVDNVIALNRVETAVIDGMSPRYPFLGIVWMLFFSSQTEDICKRS